MALAQQQFRGWGQDVFGVSWSLTLNGRGFAWDGTGGIFSIEFNF